MTLRVGLLGMPDNMSARLMVAELERHGRPVDVVFLQHADLRGQWRRLVRKLKDAGLLATLERIRFAIMSRNRIDEKAGAVPAGFRNCVIRHVGNVNAETSRQVIRDEHLDLLLLATDSLVGRGTFAIPRIATLNAHPGWAPKYRGLGSITRMLRDGLAPAVTVHVVDEGVDTGPVILREHVDPAIADDTKEGELACYREQARLFAKAIELIETRQVVPIDTFLEPSSMSRGVPAAEMRTVHASVRNGLRRLRQMSPSGTEGH